MMGTDKLVCQAAALLVLFALTLTPAKAQFGGGGGGQDMMTQMAPMLEMMKAKMGKKPLRRADADHGSDDEPHDGTRRRSCVAWMGGGGRIPQQLPAAAMAGWAFRRLSLSAVLAPAR